MKVSVTRLRSDIYNLLDHVAESGEPLELERKGRRLRIALQESPSKLQRLKSRKEKLWVGDKRDIFKIDWLSEWRKEWKIRG
jgi:hypothetical protein